MHYKAETGDKYTPFSHYKMTTQVMFNPQLGSPKANFTLSTLVQGAGSHEEVHESSDQILLVLKGSMKMFSKGELVAILEEGDAILIKAGEPHGVINESLEECVYNAVTVPPLESTH